MAMCYFSRVLETRIPSLFQQCSQLKPTIHFHLAKLKSTNIQIPINNLQSQGVKIALSENKHEAHVGLADPLSRLA